MTHDQSFPGPSKFLVNLRVNQSKLPPIVYSFTLLRTIHYILSLLINHPNMKIFLCKFDIDATYRCCTLSSNTAFESVTIFNDFLLVALRMTFGGSPCPSHWGVFSETITDIGNSLLNNKFWDHNTTYDEISDQFEGPVSLPLSIPFTKARELSVLVPQNDNGKIDIYIDDSIGIAPDIGVTPSRVSRAIPLAIRMLSRPLSDNDIISR